MDTSARLVRTARRSRGLTQRQLADVSHRAQPEIARLERSGQAVSANLVDLLIRATRCRLVVLPTDRTPVAEHADAIAEFLGHHDENRAFRQVIQLADDLAHEHGAERVALAVAPPPPTRDIRFDALIEGVTEFRLREEKLPLPRWLKGATTKLADTWFVDHYTIGDHNVIAATPEPLLRRNVVLDQSELRSV